MVWRRPSTAAPLHPAALGLQGRGRRREEPSPALPLGLEVGWKGIWSGKLFSCIPSQVSCKDEENRRGVHTEMPPSEGAAQAALSYLWCLLFTGLGRAESSVLRPPAPLLPGARLVLNVLSLPPLHTHPQRKRFLEFHFIKTPCLSLPLA